MKLRKSSLVTALVAAGIAIPFVASPASAASLIADSCSSTGVLGSYTGYYISATQIDPLRLRVDDTKADGYHTAVRLVTYDADYDKVYWKWRHYTSTGTTAGGHAIWETSALDLNNIEGAYIQVARFNGDDYIDGCTTFPKDNPYS